RLSSRRSLPSGKARHIEGLLRHGVDKGYMMKSATVLAALFMGLAAAVLPAHAASLSKTYRYYSIGGETLDEIESELGKRGPNVRSSGKRHPGATQMEFVTRLGY